MKNLTQSALPTRLAIATLICLLTLVTVSCVAPIAPSDSANENGSQPSTADADSATAESAAASEAAASETGAGATTATDAAATITSTTGTAQTDTAPDTAEAATTQAVPEPVGTYKGIPVGFTAEGYPYRGSPDAPITIYEYSDYQCPFCNRYFVQTEPAIDESYVRNGQVRVVFRDFPLTDLHPNAPAAHVASLCAAEQSAEAYWQLHGRLFQTQAEWNNSANAADYFAGLAEELGVEMDAYTACIESGEKEAMVVEGIADARALGFSGTPSFNFVREATGESFPLVGAQPYDQFAELLDSLLAGDSPATAEAGGAEEGSGEIPFWATTEGLRPDPERPGHTMAGDQYRGNPDAPVVVVEFSDLQCPFCRRHTLETQPILDEQFVDTDQIMWVFKHFPLSIHPQAPAAGVAAECAAEQGKFWEMHEALFNTMQRWSIGTPNPVFIELVETIELDLEAFTTCLDDEEMAARVDEDMAAGAAFVRGTPTFIVLYDGQGSIIPGALPAERFTEILQDVLDGTATQ